MVLREWEHTIHVDRNSELKIATIQYALHDAQRTSRYAKFICGKYYICVTFNRDYTIQISSNYRYNMRFNKEILRIESYKYRINQTAEFIQYWMNKFRKLG